MKKTDKVSLKRAFATNHRALKLIYKHYPQMVVSQLLSVIWNALTLNILMLGNRQFNA